MKTIYLLFLICNHVISPETATHKAVTYGHVGFLLLIGLLAVGFFGFLVYKSMFESEKNGNKSIFTNNAEIIMREFGDGRKDFHVQCSDHGGLEGGKTYYFVTDPNNREKKYFDTREEAEKVMYANSILRETKV